MKAILILLFTICTYYAQAQNKGKAIKFIPEASMKIGSQKPTIGGQFDLVAGLLFNDRYLVGIGGGYSTNMGMGGKTIPLFADLRLFFPVKKSFLFRSRDKENNFYIASQLGLNLNKNLPYKTGFLANFELAYKFDFIKIKQHKFPAFYTGLGCEYSYSRFKDEYRGQIIQDGVLKHLMLNIKVAFDIPSIKI